MAAAVRSYRVGRMTRAVPAVGLAAGTLLAGVVAVSPRTVGLAAADLDAGRALYTELCVRCHRGHRRICPNLYANGRQIDEGPLRRRLWVSRRR
jgi:hypothetical protein